MRTRPLAVVVMVAAAISGLATASASAATPTATPTATPKPAAKACSVDGAGDVYACMQVADRTVPSGDTVTFTGQLGPQAMSNLKDWTKGDNIVCLSRYAKSPAADGSWPSQSLEGVCATVRRDGAFTIEAEFGRKGTYYYGLEMGPCRGSAALCGNGDPGLLGVGGKRVVAVTTT